MHVVVSSWSGQSLVRVQVLVCVLYCMSLPLRRQHNHMCYGRRAMTDVERKRGKGNCDTVEQVVHHWR